MTAEYKDSVTVKFSLVVVWLLIQINVSELCSYK